MCWCQPSGWAEMEGRSLKLDLDSGKKYMEPERNYDLTVSWRLMWVLHTMQWHAEFILLKLLENDFTTSRWPRVSIFLNTFLVNQRMTFVFSYQSLYHRWISPCSCMWQLQDSLSESLTTEHFTSVWPFSIFFFYLFLTQKIWQNLYKNTWSLQDLEVPHQRTKMLQTSLRSPNKTWKFVPCTVCPEAISRREARSALCPLLISFSCVCTSHPISV